MYACSAFTTSSFDVWLRQKLRSWWSFHLRTSGDHEGDGRGGSPSRASALSERAAEKKAEKDAIERLIHASEEAAQSGKYTPIHERMSDDEAEAKYWKKEDKASNARALSLSPRARALSLSRLVSQPSLSLSLSPGARR